ncbi:polysaccharide deacetylase family protein [Candidatus Saccharibacteria bacterium]|nr:polysaccharide deacetylase family protein [Candidatus Saccharibacteria bacterium]
MSTRAKSSSKNFLTRINIRFPWLKLVATVVVGVLIILNLLDVTVPKLDDLSDNFPTTPMSKHSKATERILEGKKLVALTFDDGPFPDTTPRLLDILTEKDAIATFFSLGLMARSHPDILKRAFYEGHEIASHTMYHQNLNSITPGAVESDVNEATAVIKSIIGRTPALTRPPYGAYNQNVLDYTKTPLILWSVDPQDWLIRDPTSIINIAMSQVHDGAIILMHDIYPTSVEAVPTLIDTLRENGYEFTTVSELAKIRGLKLAPKNAYRNF